MSNGIGVPCTSGIPAPARLNAFPVTASEPSDMPWKALVNETTDSRPLTLRASFSADSTALVPVGPGNITLYGRSRGRRITFWNVSRNARLAVVAMSRPWVMPSRSM